MKHVLSFIGLISITIISTFSSNVYSSEDSVYDFSWLDKDKQIYVLQNRKYRKSSSVYIGGTLGRSLNGAFIDSNEINLLGGYFFTEEWGIELSYTKAQGDTNKTHDQVNTQGAVAFFKKIDSAATVMLTWAPFYSKINTFNKIFYYDWLFGFGFSSINTLDNRNEFGPQADPDFDELTQDSDTAIAWMTGVRFYISEGWSSRIDFRAAHANTEFTLKGEETEKRWNHYYNFNIGLNYTF